MLRIANASGFYGDRLSAAREMVQGGPIDVLTGDYLAELTMAILHKNRVKDASAGYAVTFLAQMEQVLGACVERGIKIVTNAGGLNPVALAERLEQLAAKLGIRARIACVTGDDLLPRLSELQAGGNDLAHLDTGQRLADSGRRAITANAYLGGWPIAEALARGADVVVCPRVTDASLTVGPAAWKYGWKRDDWDKLAGAVVAGHVIECGPQCTGGNYSFFREVPGLEHAGFPIAEVYEDGSSVITKHPGTGGLVSVGTVTAQLLYEIGGPVYLNPDVSARFDTIRIEQEGSDRVRISRVRGEPAPPSTKVCINVDGGYRNSITFILAGLEIEEKAALVERTLLKKFGGRERFQTFDVQLLRHDRSNPPDNEAAFAFLRVTAKDPDPKKVGRAFSSAAIEIALASYPGLNVTAPPGGETGFAVYWPTLVPNRCVQPEVRFEGRSIPVEGAAAGATGAPVEPLAVALPAVPGGPTRDAPIGRVAGARSGDKGGNANLGVWAREPRGYAWLERFLTVEKLRELLPETRDLRVERYVLPNLLALNFVIVGLLGEGVASSTRSDPQAKSLGEYLRAKVVPTPAELLGDP